MTQLDKAVQITLTGKVIGVGLRNWDQREANRRGLGGWVRNNTDRSVSIEVEGPVADVDAFVDSVGQGLLEGAEIKSKDVRESEIKRYTGFYVEY